jgi:hypothetical protein
LSAENFFIFLNYFVKLCDCFKIYQI